MAAGTEAVALAAAAMAAATTSMPTASRAPLLIVTVGLVGCGKSTFAGRLQDASQGRWFRANQDDLGSRNAVLDRASAALAKGQHVIIDRTNVDLGQRATWLDLASACHLPERHAVFFDIPVTRCATRVGHRPDHPTLSSTTKGELALSVVWHRWSGLFCLLGRSVVSGWWVSVVWADGNTGNSLQLVRKDRVSPCVCCVRMVCCGSCSTVATLCV
jgi:hypothetical protein